MSDLIKKIVLDFSNNSGDSKSALGSAGSDLNNQLGAAGQTRINTDNVAGANSTSGFSSSQTGSNGTQQGQPELERIYTDTNKGQPELVGTNINEKNPVPGGKGVSDGEKFKGRTSVINPYHLVRYHSLAKPNSEQPPELTKLGVANESINYTGLADNPAYKNPSTSFIVYHFNDGLGKEMYEKKYTYSDFLYLKHYHPFNNNRLISLRRYMIPVYDECRVAIKDAPPELRRPIAQAFSYLDYSLNNLNTLTKMQVGIKTKDVQGAGTDSNKTPTTLQEAADLLGLAKTADGASQAGIKMLSLLSGQADQTNFNTWTSAYDPWSNGPLQDLVYGPVNVTTGALVRDRGLTFSHIGDLKINFEYSSKTIEHVNQKAVMLDIFSNMLALTYNHALFWGGENRFLIERDNFPLLRAEVMYQFLKDKDITAAAKEAGNSTSNIMDKMTKIAEAMQAGSIGEILNNENIDNIKSFFTQYALLDDKNLKAYQKTILEGTKAELTGAPTGEWHLQIGNPFAPIMMLGNLWCTTCDFEFNNELSIDDFPTELKFTCTLKPGRQRDASDIQSIFNSGGGRIYYPRESGVDVNASSSTFTTEGQNRLKSDEVVNSTGRFSIDRNGERTSDLVKSKKTENKYATSLFKPIKTLIKKN